MKIKVYFYLRILLCRYYILIYLLCQEMDIYWKATIINNLVALYVNVVFLDVIFDVSLTVILGIRRAAIQVFRRNSTGK